MLEHFDGCPAQREETFTLDGVQVTRCIDCGMQVEHGELQRPEEPVGFRRADVRTPDTEDLP